MMIRALLRKQLRELGAAFLRSSKTGKARSRASAVGYALLFAVLVVVLMLCFAGMALPLASVLLPAGLDWLYFASMGLTALLVSVLASAFPAIPACSRAGTTNCCSRCPSRRRSFSGCG